MRCYMLRMREPRFLVRMRGPGSSEPRRVRPCVGSEGRERGGDEASEEAEDEAFRELTSGGARASRGDDAGEGRVRSDEIRQHVERRSVAVRRERLVDLV